MDGVRASDSIPHKPCQNISPVISVPTCLQCLHTSNFLLSVYFCTSYAFNCTWHPPYTLHYGKLLNYNSGAHQSLDIYNALPSYFSHLIFCMHTPATHPVRWHLKQLSIGGIIVIPCQEVIPQTELKHSDYLVILFEAEQTHCFPFYFL